MSIKTPRESLPFGEYCIAGAKSGKEYGQRWKGNTTELRKINDFGWLKKYFNQQQLKMEFDDNTNN